MKKMRILVSLLCVAALLCGLLAGCGKDPQPTDGTVGEGDVDIAAKIAAEPKKVSILVPGFDGSDPESVYSRAIARFEAKYGKEVEILQAVGEQLWNEKVAAQIAANDPVDVFYISVDQYLGMYLKNYLLPVDEYVDLNHPLNNKEVMDSFVKFDGKYYVELYLPARTAMVLREGEIRKPVAEVRSEVHAAEEKSAPVKKTAKKAARKPLPERSRLDPSGPGYAITRSI